jgi:predicted O-methyltransferase YrrM
MDLSQLQELQEAIRASEHKGLLAKAESLSGYSGERLVGALQRLAQLKVNADHVYLEVGVFQGLTLLSTALALQEKGDAFGIDNFAFFDPEGKNKTIVEDRRSQLQLSNAHLINSDYEDALHFLKEYVGDRKVGLYFVDGPHDYRSQLVCLLLARDHLAPGAVIVVDDSNYRFVRQANADFLRSHPEFKLLFEAYTPAHPQHMNPEQLAAARSGWWNGVNILVHDPNHLLPATFPPTPRTRELYEQDAALHSARFPESALLGTYLGEAFFQRRWKSILSLNRQFWRKFRKSAESPSYRSLNTYSEELPDFHLIDQNS